MKQIKRSRNNKNKVLYEKNKECKKIQTINKSFTLGYLEMSVYKPVWINMNDQNHHKNTW